MNIYDVLFILQFFILIGITLVKLYNVMSYNTEKKINEKDTTKEYPLWYDIKITWILFISFFIAWSMGLIILMLNPEKVLFITLFNFETLFVIVNVLFLFMELFLNISGRYSNNKIIEPYYANKQKN